MWLKNPQLCYTFLNKSFGSSKNCIIFVSTLKTKVMRGSVYRAKEKMKWVWFIPIIILFVTHIILTHEIEKSSDYWFLFITIGVIWNMAFTSYVIGKIWKNVKNRYLGILVEKILNYHRLALTSLIKKDFPTARIVIEKCLQKYDPTSILTHFVFGAYVMGSDNTQQLTELLNQVKKNQK